uniref:Uncharacterized protein n=1 Tax=Clytia hemisphaerica TaxID=252671 RepID=A0A7M5XIT4_9CNID
MPSRSKTVKRKAEEDQSATNIPCFEIHEKYIQNMDQDALILIIKEAWNNKKESMQTYMDREIMKLRKNDWYKATSSKGILKKNWNLYDDDQTEVKDMKLNFKDDDLIFGVFLKREKVKVSEGEWENDEKDLTFKVLNAGCSKCGGSEIFKFTLEESFDKKKQRVCVDGHIQCRCHTDFWDTDEEFTWYAYPK